MHFSTFVYLFSAAEGGDELKCQLPCIDHFDCNWRRMNNTGARTKLYIVENKRVAQIKTKLNSCINQENHYEIPKIIYWRYKTNRQRIDSNILQTLLFCSKYPTYFWRTGLHNRLSPRLCVKVKKYLSPLLNTTAGQLI